MENTKMKTVTYLEKHPQIEQLKTNKEGTFSNIFEKPIISNVLYIRGYSFIY